MGRGDDAVNAKDVSIWFLIDVVFGGNAEKALEVARSFPRTQYTLTPTSIERHLIIEYIRNGKSNKEIVEKLSNKDYTINKNRVRRIRQEIKNGKYSDFEKGVEYV